MAELQGQGLAGTTRTCGLRLRRAVLSVLLSYGEAASTAGVEPAPSGFVDRRLDPFGHVDKTPTASVGGAPSTGLAPATCGVTGRCCLCLSYDGTVRALGLEPSLSRGKGPVPYRLGVTRKVGRKGIEPPVSEDGWSTASCAPWRDRPNGPVGAGPKKRCLCGCQGAVFRTEGRRARPEGIGPPAVGFGDRGATMARAQEMM